MRNVLLCIAAGVAIVCFAGAAQAAGTLIYGYEAGTDGFGGNGFPGTPTITQDTIGATQLAHSMKYAVPASGTFVGALTGVVPAPLNDPPGVVAVLFDLTIPDGGAFTGAFADMKIGIFGATQPDHLPMQLFGLQAEFADIESLGAKAAGTYNDIRIDLNSATHPLTGTPNQSFNQIFGQVGSGANDLIPTGFQFIISKSGDAPITVYIDNVRVVVPEPASLSLLGLGAVGLVMFARRRMK